MGRVSSTAGYTALGYLCEQILDMAESPLGDSEHVFRLIQLIIDRCPPNLWALNFHVVINGQLHENLFLRVRQRCTDWHLSSETNALLQRLESIIVGTDDDYRRFAERLLENGSWEAAILALRDTDSVNVSRTLVRYLAYDPHLPLAAAMSISSELSLLCVFVYYALATDVHVLLDLTYTCNFIIKRETSTKLDKTSVPLVEDVVSPRIA